jgi:hypothetical protein
MKRAALLLVFLIPLTAHAWTRTSDARIAKKAAALAPTDLRAVIDLFPHEYAAGQQRAQASEGTSSHHFFVLSRDGRLREHIEVETAAAIDAVRSKKPMSELVEHLGALAHLVADANNPFHLANDNASLTPMHDDFEQYFERRLARFPTVFYGLSNDFNVTSYFDRTFARTSRYYPLLGEEYSRAQSSSGFDDRSTAFGVASVCYSHAVTDLVNLYYYIWKQAGGDTRAAPALQRGNLLLNP